jgi:hypothetical protein
MGKLFSWSFSKLSNFETCAKKYYEYYVVKNVKDDSTENIDWGNAVHDAMRDAIKEGKPLPASMTPYQPWVERVKVGPGDLLVEQKYALDQTLSPVPYFAPTVWYRGIADVARIHGPVALALDWKTGKPKEDSVQLKLMALCIFQHFPQVKVVRTEFVWLQLDPNDPNATSKLIMRREDVPEFVTQLLPRVRKLQWATETMTYPPNPSGLCVRYCKVTSCPYHGKGNR